MMRLRMFPCLLILLSSTLSIYALDSAKEDGDPDGCSLVSKSQIAGLLKVDVNDVTTQSAHPDPGHAQCDYKVVHRVVGGSDAISGEIILDYYHLANVERAQQQLATLGEKGAMLVKTSSGTTADDAVKLPEEIRTENVNREPGFAVRHNSNIVTMQMNGSFMQDRPADWAYNMQAAGLTAAGASVQGPLFQDVCHLVPAKDIQALLTLQPAKLKIDPQYQGSLKECEFTAEVDKESVETATIKVKHNQPDSEIQEALRAGSLSSMVQTQDANDKVVVPAGTRGQATAIHDSTIASIELRDPDPYAIVNPSFAYRVQRAALQAAGATVLPTSKYGPDPVVEAPKPPAPPSLWDRFSGFFGESSLVIVPVLLPVLIVGWLAFSAFKKARLRSRLTKDGLPGVALITAVGETGVTVNNSPMVRFDVTITPQNGMEYQASARQLVSRLIAPASLIGKSLPVLIDRQNPQKFIFTKSF